MRPTKVMAVGKLGETYKGSGSWRTSRGYKAVAVGELVETYKGSGSWRTRRDL